MEVKQGSRKGAVAFVCSSRYEQTLAWACTHCNCCGWLLADPLEIVRQDGGEGGNKTGTKTRQEQVGNADGGGSRDGRNWGRGCRD